jgi:hypothetical protein
MSSSGHDNTVTDDSSARGHNGDGNATSATGHNESSAAGCDDAS